MDVGNSGLILPSVHGNSKHCFLRVTQWPEHMLRLLTFHFGIRHASVWKKIHDPLGQEQEALNSSSILAMDPEPALTLVYKECLFLQVFYLTHACGVENVNTAFPVYWICWDLPPLAQVWVWHRAGWLTQG